jgi:hypothetical protein
MAKLQLVRARPYLRALIEKATADCEDRDEQHTSLLGVIEEEVHCPFRAKVGGEEVEVTAFEWPTSGYGLGVLYRQGGKQRVADVADLEWPEHRPDGAEWIDAYLLWRQGTA